MRKITVLSEKSQSKTVIETDVTTLGELKSVLSEHGVSFDSDSVFKEGRSKTILATNDSVLPSNIPWKGETTNDLVLMITAPHKKIKSGAVSKRTDLYNKVKELKLQDLIQKGEGKNFTQCTTAVLESYVTEALKKENKATKVPVAVAKEKTGNANLEALLALLNELQEKDVISKDVADNIWGVANGQPAQPVVVEDTFEDLEGLFNDWD